MKKLLAFIVVMCVFFTAMAQNPMVTLSHDGELTFFTNLTAFNSALDAAENGDIIYLSEGKFTINGGAITIDKRLSVVGNGYGSHILGNIYVSLKEGFSMDAPLFDGVRLDKLRFDGAQSSVLNAGKSEIRRCWIGSLENGGYAGTEALFDKCFIENANFSSGGYDILVRNSKIVGYAGMITAINCNLYGSNEYPNTMISCIFEYPHSTNPAVHGGSCSIINSLLNFTPFSSNVYTHECYTYTENDGEGLLDENMECTIDLVAAGYLGQDGTVVGIHGGEDPFSENPSVPTVDTDKSSVEYDAAANKLKVSITVKAD